MPATKFVQIHALQNYTGVLLNRDDSGLSKTMPYGGVVRTRISSQCLKRHWRKDDGRFSLTAIAPDPVRTKELARAGIMKRVAEQEPNLDDKLVEALISELEIGLYGPKGNDDNSRQPLLFGRPEVEHLSSKVLEIVRDNEGQEAMVAAVKRLFDRKAEGENFHVFREGQLMPAGIIGAMFGRMMASDPGANIDAPVHVAHAFTTHGEEKEIDYFTAMEEMSGTPGAAHIGDVEINSGIYYVYVCVDVPELVANTVGCLPHDWLDNDRTTAADAVSRLVGLVATVSPGAKKGSTAPYGYARSMVVEVGERQPRSLSGAYREATEPSFQHAAEKLRREIEAYDHVYGPHETRRHFLTFGDETDTTLDSLTEWVYESVVKGGA